MAAGIKESVPWTQRVALSTWPGSGGTKDGFALSLTATTPLALLASLVPVSPTEYTSRLKEINLTSSNSVDFPMKRTYHLWKEDLRIYGRRKVPCLGQFWLSRHSRNKAKQQLTHERLHSVFCSPHPTSDTHEEPDCQRYCPVSFRTYSPSRSHSRSPPTSFHSLLWETGALAPIYHSFNLFSL